MEELFKGKKFEIMREILSNPDREIHVRNIAKSTRASAGSVSIVLNLLRRMGIVKKKQVVLESPLTRSFKSFINVSLLSGLVSRMRKSFFSIGIGVYGSWQKGTNNKQSDVDLWVIVEKYPDAFAIAKLRTEIRNKLNSEPSFLFLTSEKISEMKIKNPQLYYSLYHSLALWGVQID